MAEVNRTPAELPSRLRAAPVSASPISPEILATIVAGSIAQIGVLNAEISQLEQIAVGEEVPGHDEGQPNDLGQRRAKPGTDHRVRDIPALARPLIDDESPATIPLCTFHSG